MKKIQLLIYFIVSYTVFFGFPCDTVGLAINWAVLSREDDKRFSSRAKALLVNPSFLVLDGVHASRLISKNDNHHLKMKERAY